MLFHEPLFLFLFAPFVYCLYRLLGSRRGARLAVLLVASILFYAWSEPRFVFIVFAAILADFLIAQRIAADGRAGGLWLALGVAANLGVLVYFKYAGFLVGNLDALMRGFGAPGLALPAIALPIGVSFIVFEKITYLVDVRRGVTAPAKSLSLYAFYVFFFPKLLAGPIVKYHEIAAQLERFRHADAEDFVLGFSRFMLGVAQKLLIADTLANGADLVFAADASRVGCADAWVGALFFAFQIYFDFTGYSNMAIGLARMFGFRLPENFDRPYVAASVTEFWRRWHISLTTWIKDYLYIPLGGNRLGGRRTQINLWICFLASGLWHGAAWTYVAWGAYNGFFLALERVVLLDWLKRRPAWLANLFTFLVVMIGWTLFRATSLEQAGLLLLAMARPWPSVEPILFPAYDLVVLLIAAAICVAQRPALSIGDRAALAQRFAFAANSALALLFACAVGKGLADPFKPFIYFRF
ncbi:MBOAT family protein [Methylosinus sp. Sm6]|uniref:MBOAT family O-acyltransferase n=1 Tax=Methylosinus sp. Sm6 TaxID=2866948 RepID=UPI001C98F38F|nr:MBOAT family O-acyltransferase [Methylosinus sp. Sm6]MBY6241027.1 MBOAT family protein [Methylosinus sp. Sm6]